MSKWDQHYTAEEPIFDIEPCGLVRRVRPYLPVASRALDLAMGEGCSGVFLAQCKLSAEGVDSSPVAIAKTEEMVTLKGVDFAERVADITVMRMPPGHYAAISSVCCHFVKPVRSRLARGIVDVLIPGGLFIDVFYHPGQTTLEKGLEDRTALADMVELQTAFDGLEWLIAEHCYMGEGGEARSTVCPLGRKTLSDGI